MTSEENNEREEAGDEKDWSLEAQRLFSETEKQVPDSFWRLARLYEDGRGVERDLELAFELRKQGAELGEPNAIVELGYAYEYAVGTPYDVERARELYEQALEASEDFETRGFALCQTAWPIFSENVERIFITEAKEAYEFRFDTKDERDSQFIKTLFHSIDPDESPFFCRYFAELIGQLTEPNEVTQKLVLYYNLMAADVFVERAQEGNGVAAGEFAYMGTFGVLDVDPDMVSEFLELSVESGYPPALVIAGHTRELEGKIDEALALYLRSEAAGYDEGICKVGLIYRSRGEMDKAVERFKRGAELEHAPSLYFLGAYYDSLGDPESLKLADKCLKRSAELDFPFAQEKYGLYLFEQAQASENPDWKTVANMFGACLNEPLDLAKAHYACLLYKGKGVDKDVKAAARLFDEVSNGEDVEAKQFLASKKLEGDWCDYDPEGAVKILESIGDQAPDALVLLGFLYFTGDEVEQDFTLAARYFALAAAQRDPVGAANFAKCCYEGRGVLKNEIYGQYFLRLAAELGEPGAAFALGRKFEFGDDVERNWVCAENWYRAAALGGVSDAFIPLATCYWNGFGVKRNEPIANGLWELADCDGDPEAVEEQVRAKLSRTVEQAFGFDASEDYADELLYAAQKIYAWISDAVASGEDAPERKEFLLAYVSALAEYVETGGSASIPKGSWLERVVLESGPEDAVRRMYRVCVERGDMNALFNEGASATL